MNRLRLVTFILIALAFCLSGSSYAASVSDFVVFDYYRINGSGVSVVYMPGLLYVPSNYDPAQTYPLVLFLHGYGERTPANAQVNTNINNLLAAAKARGFFLLAPQSSDGWWQSYKITTTMKMISLLAESYNIDMERVYVTGLSAGGGGSWQAIGDYRDIFAGAVPIVASGGYDAAGLPGKPIWIYGALNDQFLTIGRNMVNAIRAADGGKPALVFPLNNNPSNPYYNTGSPYYTDGSTFYSENNLCYSEYSSGGHTLATWGRAYAESPMYDWLLSQSNPLYSLSGGETILFDLGATATAADAQGRVWNSAAVYKDEATLGPAVPYAMTTGGLRTTVTLSVVDGFYGVVARGVTGGPLYPDTTTMDGWLARTNDPAILRFKGLSPGQEYQITIFASDTDSDGANGRLSRYTIGGQHRDLNIVNNVSNVAIFESVFADSLGEITLSVSPTGTSRYAEIGAIELTAIPEAILPGDYNGDGVVDLADYTVWADHFGQTGSGIAGDGNGDGVVDLADYTIWADHFGETSAP